MKWEKLFFGWIFNGAKEDEYWFRKNNIVNPTHIFRTYGYNRIPQSVSDILFQKFLLEEVYRLIWLNVGIQEIVDLLEDLESVDICCINESDEIIVTTISGGRYYSLSVTKDYKWISLKICGNNEDNFKMLKFSAIATDEEWECSVLFTEGGAQC